MTMPLPSYHFQVDWGGSRVGFTEVLGLSMEIDMIDYREGSSPKPTADRIPGLQRPGNITLKRGVMPADNEFFDWYRTAGIATAERRDMTISLLGEDHAPRMTWKVSGAVPVSIDAPPLRAQHSEIAIETLVLACESIAVETP